MSIEKLISTLKKEALDREEVLMDDARKEASAIIGEAEKITANIEVKIAKIAKESDERKKLIRSGNTAIEKRNFSVSIENRYIAEIAAKCRELYGDFMDKKEYADIVKSDYSKIKAEVKDIGEIRADPLTAGILKKMQVKEKVVSDENADYGFAAITPNGEITVTSTFGKGLEKLLVEVAPEYVRKIGDLINAQH